MMMRSFNFVPPGVIFLAPPRIETSAADEFTWETMIRCFRFVARRFLGGFRWICFVDFGMVIVDDVCDHSLLVLLDLGSLNHCEALAAGIIFFSVRL